MTAGSQELRKSEQTWLIQYSNVHVRYQTVPRRNSGLHLDQLKDGTMEVTREERDPEEAGGCRTPSVCEACVYQVYYSVPHCSVHTLVFNIRNHVRNLTEKILCIERRVTHTGQ